MKLFYPFLWSFTSTNWIFFISSLLFRYSIFKELLLRSKSLEVRSKKLDFRPPRSALTSRPPTFEVFGRYLVEIKGIEPLTPCLQSRCSPSWAKPPFYNAQLRVHSAQYFLEIKRCFSLVRLLTCAVFWRYWWAEKDSNLRPAFRN